MRYQSGEYVVYRNWNICKVEEVTNKCFDGESTVQYLELRPTDSNGIIYVPPDKLEKCIRPILTQTELLDISEISYSLGISPEMVEHFIEDRLNK